jgi:hypothetical protein
LLGLAYQKSKVLGKLPDGDILVLKCVACHAGQKKQSFANYEMPRAINEDHSITAGLGT